MCKPKVDKHKERNEDSMKELKTKVKLERVVLNALTATVNGMKKILKKLRMMIFPLMCLEIVLHFVVMLTVLIKE